MRAQFVHTAWLIERTQVASGDAPEFYGPNGWGDADAAMRFCRQLDAENAAMLFRSAGAITGVPVFASDHSWDATPVRFQDPREEIGPSGEGP